MNKYKLYGKLLEADISKSKENKKRRKLEEQQQQEQQQKQAEQQRRRKEWEAKLIPISQLKTRYDYTCDRCNAPIAYDTLWLDDISGRYIPLDPNSMRPHYRTCSNIRRMKKEKEVAIIVR